MFLIVQCNTDVKIEILYRYLKDHPLPIILTLYIHECSRYIVQVQVTKISLRICIHSGQTGSSDKGTVTLSLWESRSIQMKLVIFRLFISIHDFRCVKALILIMILFDLYDLPTLFCVFFILAGLRAALDAKTVFRSSLPCKKNCSTLFWRRQDRFWESVLREASDLVRASGCGESRNGGRWVSRDHPPRPRWAKRAQKLGATHIWDCHTKGRVKHCQTWATHCQTWATYCQSWATYCQNWATDCLVDCPTQLTLAIWICQLNQLRGVEKCSTYYQTGPRATKLVPYISKLGPYIVKRGPYVANFKPHISILRLKITLKDP